MLVGAQLALPGPVAAGVRAGRPEIGTAAEKPAVAQDQHAAVAALHAVEHMHVNGIKPIFHSLKDIARDRVELAEMGKQVRERSLSCCTV